MNIYFVAAGDISFSGGSRTLFREMLKAFEREGFQVHCRFFQMRMEHLSVSNSEGKVHVEDFPFEVFSPTSKQLFERLPRPLFRIYERMVIGLYLWRWLKNLNEHDRIIFHGCLGILHTLPFRIKSKYRWWYKVGVIEEEMRTGFIYHLRKLIEYLNANYLGKRIVVSHPMGLFVQESYGQHIDQSFVLPCLVNQLHFHVDAKIRKQRRLEMGLQNKLVVLYLGSAEVQQSPAETIRYFSRLREQRKDAFLWILSADQEVFYKLLMKTSLPRNAWLIDNKPYKELQNFLPAADVALLLRPEGLVNRVSSPVKFPEYLINGLAVIIGPEVGEYTGMVREHKLGVVVDPRDESNWGLSVQDLLSLLEDRQNLRQRCFNAADKLSWQGYSQCIRDEFSISGLV